MTDPSEYERLAKLAGEKKAGTVDRKIANLQAIDALVREITRDLKADNDRYWNAAGNAEFDWREP